MSTTLLFAHVVGAILLIGPTTLATSRFARFAVAGDLGSMRQSTATARTYGAASVVVPVIGLVMALRDDLFGLIWIDTALTVVVVAGVLLFAVHLPAQRTAIAAVHDGGDVAATTLTRLRVSAGLYATAWVAIVWLMVAKPS